MAPTPVIVLALLLTVPVAAADPLCVGSTCGFVMPSDGACVHDAAATACASDGWTGNSMVCPEPAVGSHGFTGVDARLAAGVHVIAGGADTRCDPPFFGNHRVTGVFVRVETFGGVPGSSTMVRWQDGDAVWGEWCAMGFHHAGPLGPQSEQLDCVAGPAPDPQWGRLLP